MTDAAGLAGFVRARLDDERAAAQAAIDCTGDPRDDGAWQTGGDDGTEHCVVTGGCMIIHDEGGHWPEQAAHIARHDPARVLADVEAQRLIIGEYTLALERARRGRGDPAAAGALLAMLRVVKILALPHAGHPDYRPGWAPKGSRA